MDIVLLPGNDKSNKVWIDAVDVETRGLFTHTIVHYYDHWWKEGSGLVLDIDSELERLATQLDGVGRSLIFAKSAGVVLALYGIYEGVLDPEVAVFVGTPIQWARDQGYDVDNWLINYSLPTLFIQQEHDPAVFANDLETFLSEKNVTHHMLRSIPGSDHRYSDVAQLVAFMKEFVDL
jgi:hypothetical protein